MSKKQRLILISLLVCAVVLSSFAIYVTFIDRGYTEVCFISVGQGDSCLVRSSGGDSILIDGGDDGSGEHTLIPFFRKQFVNALDAVFVSHMHSDHTSGITELIENDFPIEMVYVSENAPKEDGYKAFAYTVTQNDIPITYISEDDSLVFGDVTFTVLETGAENPSDDNDYSVIMRMDCGENSFLFTGDATKKLERELLENPDIDVDFLKVSHHGSRDSSDYDFIEKASPIYSIISVGADNKYKHPHREVLDTMTAQGIIVMRTDTDGNVTFVIDENGLLDVQKGRKTKENLQ